MYLKRITNRDKLNILNYKYAHNLRDEVDPNMKIDFWGYDVLLENPLYYYYEIYKDATVKENKNMLGFVSFWMMKYLFSTFIFGSLDNIYIIPSCRGYLGGKIITKVEQLVKANGGTQMWWSPHPDTPMDNIFKNHDSKYYHYGNTYVRNL